jgi:hypothetical protein
MRLWWCPWWGLVESAFGSGITTKERMNIKIIDSKLKERMKSSEDVFTFRFYNFFTFNMICNDNATVNCITV